MNTIYTSGRIQKQRKRNTHTPVSARAKSVIDAVTRAMREELCEAAWMRWCLRVNNYIGSDAFDPSGNEADAGDIAAPVPRVWCPSKPKLALALLNELHRSDMNDSPTNPPKASPCVGTERHITKVLARRTIESMREDKGLEWLEACGELTDAQLKDSAKLSQTLARVAFDVFVFMHARAIEIQREQGADDAVIALHSSDQTLTGKALRGCGVVCCADGRGILARAITRMKESLEPTPLAEIQ
jgi:hypothetical protein